MKNLIRGLVFLWLFLLFPPFESKGQSPSAITSGGWYMRGSGTNVAYYSIVAPLDGQQGVLGGPSVTNLFNGIYGDQFNVTNLLQVNGTNTNSLSVLSDRYIITNAVASFGTRYGGSPLYVGQSYDFGLYGGNWNTPIANNALLITVVNRSDGSFNNQSFFDLPVPANTSDWDIFVTNGLSRVFQATDLTVTFSQAESETWGLTNESSLMELNFMADTAATNYEYTIWVVGTCDYPYAMIIATTSSSENPLLVFYDPVCTLDFDPVPTNLPAFAIQPQFQGTPTPPTYEGVSLTELQTAKTVVTNAVNSAATNYLDLDTSPELRDHPTLDQFVANMGSNALALTAYVFNQIELTDAFAYNGNTNNLTNASLNLGGMNRSAYDTYMEGQGSPLEQCALLVYLLRRSGVPAAYIFGPTNGIQMLDSDLSSLLQMQIHGIVNQSNGQVYTTNTLISVNYPWVAAYINGQWIHLFPWLKNTEVTEGLNLWDYMPAGYNTDDLWLNHYLTGDTNILGLSTESDLPSVLFPLFLQQALLTNAPGVSLDDIGTTAINRQVQFNQWSDFPTPYAVTNGTVNTVDNLTTITNIFPSWTNIWDTINILVQSSYHTNNYLYTGDLRMVDLQDRKFLIRQQTNGPTSPLTVTLTLSLAPYRPTTATNVTAFTNDLTLTNQQILQMTLTNTDDPINVVFTRKRHRTEPSGVTNVDYTASYGGLSETLQLTTTSSLRFGDLAAICLHSGRVSKQMLTPWAQEYWAMQQEVASTPSLTNTISPDITEGTLPYLMGMSYFERCSTAEIQLANLHKMQLGSMVGQGLSMLGAERSSTNGSLVTPINLYHPHVDMFFQEVTFFGNSALQPDSQVDPFEASYSFGRLFITETSAQEHQITEDFYGQNQGISTVRLLREAYQLNPTNLVELNINNYLAASNYLAAKDTNIWAQVVAAFSSNYIANVFITANPVTNTTVGYQGMGALIFSPNLDSALISGNGLAANGGWGEPLDDPIYNPPSFGDITLSFDTSPNNNWSVTYFNPGVSPAAPLAATVSYWSQPATYTGLSSGTITFGGANMAQQNAFDVASFNLGYTGANAAPDSYADAVNNGGDYDAHIGPEYAQLASTIADPVNAVTGEYYINADDLTLPGAMPLFIRRNYSSQDVDLGDTPFGYGWRPAYTPYLRLVTNNLIYAAELDGTVVAYRQPTLGTNYWMPLPADNPQLNNRSSVGIGSTANLFNNYITTNTTGGTTNYVLTGADGSVRLFEYLSYPIPTTNDFTRTRPYLQTWTDAKGNGYSFTYQTDNTQPDYGQLLRVQNSNGNFFGFYYDVFAHITQAYTGDGRILTYDYDSYGDLVTVTLPDESQINYVYQHTNSVTNTVTGGVTNSVTNIFSTHLIAQEQKPNGRTVANTYDSLRRVVIQAATVGDDLNLVTNATFLYSNNFTNLTNSIITGTTYITNVFGKVTTYQYTSNLITSIVDALGQTDTQVWFSNTNDTGYYPHSLKSRTDKRGLNTAYQYDARGNLAQVVLTGNLTGGTATNETATYTSTYTSLNLLSTATDPSTNETVYYYTNPAYPMLPTSVVKLAGSTPVTTNQFFYTNVIQPVTNGAVLATNSAYGLLQEVIRGSFGTNTFLYNGQGFLTQSTRYTGTADPSVTATLFYSERGELIQQTDALGRSNIFAYDAMGRPTEEETYEAGASTPEGYKFSYYNENGDLVWTQGSRYNPVDYIWRDYDGAGRKITEMRWRSEANTNGSGVEAPAAITNLYSTTFYQYDAFNNLTQVTDPLGNYTIKEYDAIGQLTNEVAYSAAGTPMATNRYSYEPGGLVSAVTNALGGVTTKLYTYRGKLMSQTNADGSTQSWQYYLDGRLNKEFLPNGNYWQTTYNDAALTVTRIFYNFTTSLATNVTVMDTRGNVIQKTDADGFVYTNFYDGLDRLKIAAGPATTNIFVPGINPASTNFQTNIAQQVTTYIYDAAGQTLTTSNALGETVVKTSDALGRPTQVAIYNSSNVTAVRVTSTAYSADHQSVTVSNGTGAGAIVSTIYTDNDGHPVLTIASPTNGVTEFTWWKYDLAGNKIAWQQCSSNTGGFMVWATNGWTYDGLNRVQTETTRDGATTTYSYDALGDVTNRAMPGGLSWSASYLNDGRMASEQESGGSLTARSMSYTYYSAGNPFAGCLELVTDGRSTTRSNSYDDFMRLASVTTTGSNAPQQTLTTYQYDPRSSLTNLSQSFATNTTGFPTAIVRGYDGYRRIVSDQTSVSGSPVANMTQGWDQAGRRTALNSTQFGYQADGKLVSVVNNSGTSTFGYGNNGLLTGRTNGFRTYLITQRDGRGRVLQTTTTPVGTLTAALTENLGWRNDGKLSSYTALRGDFNDYRNYAYSSLAQRLTQESFYVSNSTIITNSYTIDNGSTGGLGILTASTQSGAGSGSWNVPGTSGLDGLGRVAEAQDNIINRPAYGEAYGAETVSATLDGRPVSVDYDTSEGGSTWRANLDLSHGSHTLLVTAVDSTGQYSGSATNTFTVTNTASDTITNTYDGNGNVTQRVWVSGTTTNRLQTLTWDAFDRLIAVTDRDTTMSNGFNWVATYDGLGRRISTGYTMVVSNVPIVDPPDSESVINSMYDPQVEFLETAVNVNGVTTMKTYGPDASGAYGGMQGVGGLEVVRQAGFISGTGLVQDFFGNIIGTISSTGSVTWSTNRFSSYGPVPGYQSPALSLDTTLAQTLGWRGKRVDETGLICLGARHYDPVAGRFLSADPFGYGASQDLYSFCGGDPLNRFDPTGRFGKEALLESAASVDDWFNSTVSAPMREIQESMSHDNDFIAAYEQTQADIQSTLMQGYYEVGAPGFMPGQGLSSFLNMVPIAGAIKQYIEQGYSGADLITGSRVDQMSVLGETTTVGLNLLSAYPFVGGMMAEAAGGAELGIANWQAGNVLKWQAGVGNWDLALIEGGVQDSAGVIPTQEGLIEISQHLSSLDADPGNAIMYSRLIDALETGRTLTGVDANFYVHELTESSLMDSGLDWQTAHAQTLELQGIPYAPGYTSQLYTPEALRASEAFDQQLLLDALKH